MTHITNIEHRDEVKKDLGFGPPVILAGEGWYVSCNTCNWEANNPVEDETAADEVADYHVKTAEIEEAREAAVLAFYAAESDEEREAATAAYLQAGVINRG